MGSLREQPLHHSPLELNSPVIADRKGLFQRHDWVWISPQELDLTSISLTHQDLAQQWISDHPLVVTRRSAEDLSQSRLRLGLCIPNSHGAKPHRFSLSCNETQVRAHRPALMIEEIQQALQAQLTNPWQQILTRLAYLQARSGFSIRIYGSLAWQAHYSGATSFLREESDLDLLVVPPPNVSKQTNESFFQQLEVLSDHSESMGGPRIDGELRLREWGDVSWREWLQASHSDQIRVLSKFPDSVRLVALDCAPRHETNKGFVFHPDQLDEWAITALRAEAMAWPKPGLVSPVDQGSHPDMDIQLLIKAIHSLRSWFGELARAAQAGAEFKDLAAIGRAAETVMLHATQGVNVYRGAIFNLGLLVASAAISSKAEDIPNRVATRWGQAILDHKGPPTHHGAQLRRRYGSGGALHEAGKGFPTLTRFALPAYLQAHRQGLGEERALIASLMVSMEHLEDTNLLWRGGPEGLMWAKQIARGWNQNNGMYRADWRASLADHHQQFIQKRLSPGGSADLAACAHFLSLVAQKG